MVSLAEKPLTGKLNAGNPPVQFGGRGGANHATPTPIYAEARSLGNLAPVPPALWHRQPGRVVLNCGLMNTSYSLRVLAVLNGVVASDDKGFDLISQQP